jgi:hypothetical protein
MAGVMKDSEVEWIGEIPEGWDISKVKYVGRYINGYAFKPDQWGQDGLPIIRIQNLSGSSKSINYFDGKISDDYLIDDGDILISWSATLDAFIWNYGKGWLNQHIFKAIPNVQKIHKSYFFHLMKIAMLNMSSDKHGSAMQHVTNQIFGNFQVPLPSLSEQKLIADFLDEKCAEIDRLSEDIQKQIDILNDYKKAVIYKALTGGLSNKNILDTSDGVWKTIPESWSLVDIKYLFEIVKRIAGKEGYDVLSVTQSGLKAKDITSGEGQLADDYSKYQLVYPTDYVMNHMDLLTGWVDLSDKTGVTSPDYRVFRLRDKKNNSLEYFKYVMQCCYMNRIFYSLGQGVSNLGRWRLQTSAFNNFKIPVPPLNEQNDIVRRLTEIISDTDRSIELKEKQLEKIVDYKKSIIYEYTTGKKRVKGEL